ncbi:isoprenyl transferase [Cytophaga aurantiaca]|uniref:isoprenyl transferase n=1 Tax=Cytophaga aurantiaca TaxID=29530 RepID=UPI0003814B04|nr:isoprenyl transferase [Cytophaga aurantiaca]
MEYQSNIDPSKLPEHIAIIMDGNGRWAKKQGLLNRIFGHKSAITSVRETTETCAELGIKYLTLYAFSTENWSRPKEEVNALMELLVSTIKSEAPTLTKNNVRLNAIGDLASLPKSCQKELAETIELTKHNSGLVLTLALSYSGRWEIIEAVKKIALAVSANTLAVDSINDTTFRNYLSDSTLPDPELLIRTSGEFRVSNFLLWQIAYTEIHITDVLWPDFRKNDLYTALIDFQKRERRFGKISEQLNGAKA